MIECTANDNTSEEPHMRSEVEIEHNTLDGNAAHEGETDLNVENPIRRPPSESQQPASVDPYVLGEESERKSSYEEDEESLDLSRSRSCYRNLISFRNAREAIENAEISFRLVKDFGSLK
ncbi:hypothetical protein MRB53_027847 [Persea americana]|uniref:Uncharacterized protein n=1 Tax=Persea americana TaxID=3435 RepID=A0ACC2KEH5_PERAE|nr:hypothetical protein MRB53_027847 [Persea americana]